MLTDGLHVRPLEAGGLAGAYLAGRPEALAFFPGAPDRAESYRTRWEGMRGSRSRADRAGVARLLRPTSAAAGARLDRFVEEGGGVVTTGQQPGFLTGPLLTIGKALGAVRLARDLEGLLGTVVLPVFWIASEDHDWDEVRTAWLGGEGTPTPLSLGPPDGRTIPLAERRFAGLEDTFERMAQLLVAAPFGVQQVERIEAVYRPGRTVAQTFADLLADLLSGHDLLLADASCGALKAASVPVLGSELDGWEASVREVREQSGRIEQLGHRPQVAALPGASHLFLRTEAGRERLYHGPAGWETRETGLRLSTGELRGILRDEPRRVSPSALLRPVVEAAVLPVLAYLAGPAEIAYLAQADALFRLHGVARPVVAPRPSILVVEPGVRERLGRLGLHHEQLARPSHELWEEIARNRIPPGIAHEARQLRAALIEGYARLAEAGDADPPAAGSLGARRDRALLAVHRAERTLVRSWKRRHPEVRADLTAVLGALRPRNAPQERVLNVVPFLARHGDGLLHELASRAPSPLAPEGG